MKEIKRWQVKWTRENGETYRKYFVTFDETEQFIKEMMPQFMRFCEAVDVLQRFENVFKLRYKWRKVLTATSGSTKP